MTLCIFYDGRHNENDEQHDSLLVSMQNECDVPHNFTSQFSPLLLYNKTNRLNST